MNDSGENTIELTDVTKRFGSNLAVDRLTLSVPKGSIYGVIGPNGSGKTTSLRMILRIIHPDSGIVSVLGKTSGTVADNRLGYLPEERGLYKRMKVVELLTYYARLKGFYKCKTEIHHWLERFGATEWANRRIDGLSKGMSQKVQFISAVVAKPELLILDEPFSGLDPVNMESIRDAVLSLRSSGTTIIFSTHDMDVAEQMCDSIFMIFKGKKVLDGSLAEIKREYQSDECRVRLSNPDDSLPEIHGVESVVRKGEYHSFWLSNSADRRAVLEQLVSQADIEHFEVCRPSLHEIFVRIARPEIEAAPQEPVSNSVSV